MEVDVNVVMSTVDVDVMSTAVWIVDNPDVEFLLLVTPLIVVKKTTKPLEVEGTSEVDPKLNVSLADINLAVFVDVLETKGVEVLEIKSGFGIKVVEIVVGGSVNSAEDLIET